MKYSNRGSLLKNYVLILCMAIFGLVFKGAAETVAAQTQNEITGQVTDSQTGEPLPGVNIVVKGTDRGTTTNVEGVFQLTVESLQDTLVFSYVSFETTTIPIDGQTTINVELIPSTVFGDELVVVGYGTQRKSDVTGSVSSVKSEDITAVSTATLQDALQGRMAGVNITPQSGRPGSQPVVRIRGVGTLNNSNPLYVVDGMLLDDIAFLDNRDVASVEVLKDASATAIYGSRGANGVIVITTKKGVAGEPRMSVNSYAGIQRVNNMIEMANAHEYAILANESAANRGASPIFEDPDQYGEGFDWQDWLINDASIQSHQVGASGGTENMIYNVSGNYLKQDGVVRKSDFERVSLRVNNEYFLTENIHFGHNINFAYENFQNESQGGDGVTGLLMYALQADPTLTPRNEDGEFTDVSVNGGRFNPAAVVAYNHNENDGFRTTGNVYLEIGFLKNFNFRSNFGINWRRDNQRTYLPEHFVTPLQFREENQLVIFKGDATNWLNENTVEYANDFGNHSLNLLAGISAQEFVNSGLTGRRLNIPTGALSPNYDLLFLNAGETEGQTTNNGSSTWGMMSNIFRANYNYDDRYLLTATFRRDGSSRFAERNRWGNFPSAAAGWIISNEPFMEGVRDASGLDFLKLRGSWGRIGNDKIDTDAAVATVTSNLSYVLGTGQELQTGAAVTELSNPDIRWEETEQLDIGLELALFDSRFNTELDWYRRETKDILVEVPIPNIVGVTGQPVVNAASVLNTGFEVNLNWQDSGTDFRYEIGLTGTTVDNEVLSLGGGREEITGGGVRNLGSTTRTIVGQEIGAFYGWKQIGIFQNQDEIDNSATRGDEEPGDIKIADINGYDEDGELLGEPDGIIDDADKTFLGSPIPDFYYGINLSAAYKNFDFSMLFDGQGGNKILYARTVERGFGQFNYEKFMLDRWTGEGTSNTEPRISEAEHNYQVLDRFLYDGDFFRLRNLTLGYTLPVNLLSQFNVRRFRIYLNATNLFTLTEYPGYTPQIGGGAVIANGIDNGTYPVTSNYTIGVEISF
ncbi:MAG: TonB-dependent receptor [Balneolaceae bacterium]